MTESDEALGGGIDEPCCWIEDNCRFILEHWRAGFTSGLRMQDQESESVVLDAVKSATVPTTPSEAFAHYRCLVETRGMNGGDDQMATETRTVVVAALEDVIAGAEARSVSDMHARINFIDGAASHGVSSERVSACANSLRRDLYALCRRSRGAANELQS